MYTLGQAAKETGKAKSTISKAIRNGKLSASKDVHGQYAIDPVELFRIWPMKNGETDETPRGGSRSNDNLLIENRGLQERIKLLEQHLDEMKSDRDEWRKQARTLLLDTSASNTGFWQRLFKRKAA